MHGRVYDPELGRFLSADPFVQAPYNSQSYNRYAYVFNNPLSFTDPTGYQTSNSVDLTPQGVHYSSYVNPGEGNTWHFDFSQKACDVDVCVTGSHSAFNQALIDRFNDYSQRWNSFHNESLQGLQDGSSSSLLRAMASEIFNQTVAQPADEAVEKVEEGDFEGAILAGAQIFPVGKLVRMADKVKDGEKKVQDALDTKKSSSQIDRAEFRKEREAFWRAEEKNNSANYSESDLARMRQGKPPIGSDGYPMELHHVDKTMEGGIEPMTRTDHRLGENYKKNHTDK
jgi:hypothetical protein